VDCWHEQNRTLDNRCSTVRRSTIERTVQHEQWTRLSSIARDRTNRERLSFDSWLLCETHCQQTKRKEYCRQWTTTFVGQHIELTRIWREIHYTDKTFDTNSKSEIRLSFKTIEIWWYEQCFDILVAQECRRQCIDRWVYNFDSVHWNGTLHERPMLWNHREQAHQRQI
jgi:hypothetical protein